MLIAIAMNNPKRAPYRSRLLSRRRFIGHTAVGAAGLSLWPKRIGAEPPPSALAEAIAKLDPYFTPQDRFRDVSRGQPFPHLLSDEKKRKVGLTRETWKLEVISDAEHPATIRHALTKKEGTALDFPGLLKLAEKHAVRFAKTMTCLNIGCPLGTGIWEGVPLREVLWLTRPRENLRRIFYYGYHNDDPAQMFRSSLPVDRVLEEPFDLPPVILCYKLNGQWLSSERGGPVRMVVPEAYGFKSIKWLSHVVLTNLYHANDTYADGNNDVESTLKTFAATISVAAHIKPSEPIPVTGYAQVGLSGLSKVQVWLHPSGHDWLSEDKYFTTAPWTDAQVLPPPKNWGEFPDGKLPSGTLGFDESGAPRTWPMRLGKIYWAALLPGQPAGDYTLRCRTVDEKGAAQPMPRPFQKSGNAAIEAVEVNVRG